MFGPDGGLRAGDSPADGDSSSSTRMKNSVPPSALALEAGDSPGSTTRLRLYPDPVERFFRSRLCLLNGGRARLILALPTSRTTLLTITHPRLRRPPPPDRDRLTPGPHYNPLPESADLQECRRDRGLVHRRRTLEPSLPQPRRKRPWPFSSPPPTAPRARRCSPAESAAPCRKTASRCPPCVDAAYRRFAESRTAIAPGRRSSQRVNRHPQLQQGACTRPRGLRWGTLNRSNASPEPSSPGEQGKDSYNCDTPDLAAGLRPGACAEPRRPGTRRGCRRSWPLGARLTRPCAPPPPAPPPRRPPLPPASLQRAHSQATSSLGAPGAPPSARVLPCTSRSGNPRPGSSVALNPRPGRNGPGGGSTVGTDAGVDRSGGAWRAPPRAPRSP